MRKLVEVEWLDAAFFKGWHTPPDFVKPSPSRTMGYLVFEGTDHIIVAMNSEDGDNGAYGDSMAIPRAMMVKITELRKIK